MQQNKLPLIMKVFVLGASGLIGHAVCEALARRGHTLITLRHQSPLRARGIEEVVEVDGTDLPKLTQAIIELWPDALVNAAAISSPEAVEKNPKLAERLNVALPRQLAQITSHLGTRFIHLSTDMVFDGTPENAPFRSTDLPNPKNLYGQLKLMAEREVLEHNTEDPVVLRLTLTNGNSPGGVRSVHEKLLHAIARGERPTLYSDELRQPCSAENVGDAITELVERRDLHGIFHWAGSETITRYALGQRILQNFSLSPDLIQEGSLADSGEQPREACHLAFTLDPLVGKLKTLPASIERQISELSIPPALRDWYAQARR